MIQRIQSIFLLVAAVCAALTLKFSFYSGIAKGLNTPNQYYSLNATGNIFLLILTVAVAVASAVTIFMYKDRRRQLLVTVSTAIVAACNLILYFSETEKFERGQASMDLTSIIAISVPVWLLLAARSIYKDEKLVKSVDRLR